MASLGVGWPPGRRRPETRVGYLHPAGPGLLQDLGVGHVGIDEEVGRPLGRGPGDPVPGRIIGETYPTIRAVGLNEPVLRVIYVVFVSGRFTNEAFNLRTKLSKPEIICFVQYLSSIQTLHRSIRYTNVSRFFSVKF